MWTTNKKKVIWISTVKYCKRCKRLRTFFKFNDAWRCSICKETA